MRLGENAAPCELKEVIPQEVIVDLRIWLFEQLQNLAEVVIAICAHPGEETLVPGSKHEQLL